MAGILSRKTFDLAGGGDPARLQAKTFGVEQLGIGLENTGAAALNSVVVSARVSDAGAWEQLSTVSGAPLVAWVKGSLPALPAGQSAVIALNVGYFAEVKVEANSASATSVALSFCGI